MLGGLAATLFLGALRCGFFVRAAAKFSLLAGFLASLVVVALGWGDFVGATAEQRFLAVGRWATGVLTSSGWRDTVGTATVFGLFAGLGQWATLVEGPLCRGDSVVTTSKLAGRACGLLPGFALFELVLFGDGGLSGTDGGEQVGNCEKN